MGAIEADGISQILIPMPTTKIASDLWSRALLVSLFRPIKSANATRLGGHPRQVLCAHRWRPDQLRSELRPCELRLVDVARVVGPARRKSLRGTVSRGLNAERTKVPTRS